MKLTITQGNYAHFDAQDWVMEGRLRVTSSTATRRSVAWQSGGTNLRATMNWNSSTQLVSSFSIQFQGSNGSWYSWMNASSVGLTYSAVTRSSTQALSRDDVIDFRPGSGGNDLYGGAGNDTIYGGGSRDVIDGGSGRDVITAGGGNDVVRGGTGADRLTGGSGADRFRYQGLGERGDTITDFRAGSDRLEFRSGAFGRLTRGALATNRFQMRASASSAGTSSVRFVFNRAQHTLYYDSDGRGGRAPVKIATLTGVNSLSAGSIFIV